MAIQETKETMSETQAKTLYRVHFPNWWTHKNSNPRDSIESMYHASAISHYEGFMAALVLSGQIEAKK